MTAAARLPLQPDARRVMEDAIAARIFPAAAVEVGSSTGAIMAQAFGRLTFAESAEATSLETPFDLASLTKVLATTTVAMELARTGALRLDERVASFFTEWRGPDRENVTVADLLEHASGLSARLIDAHPAGRREFEHDICTMPLEYAPRSRSTYSDLGFILLGFLLADRGGASLAAEFESIVERMRSSGGAGSSAETTLGFSLSSQSRQRAAPTMPMREDARRGRMLTGEVHDDYAAALGGVAGHAGLFGTAPAVGALGRMVLRALRGDATLPAPWLPELAARFVARSTVPGSSRALGWDTMLPTSSCGTRMSRSAVGHVGFTGTSLWIDPDRDRYFVLLTNRVCGGGTLDEMRGVRRAFHDALGLDHR
jgi:CubicO group peptidase (beta-lactamase class C family)